MKSFYWDFFGPRAQGTAQHFLLHLREFLKRNDCPQMPTGLKSEGAGHQAVFCSPPSELEAMIEVSLRPRRSTEA